jgi:hypothetical protein
MYFLIGMRFPLEAPQTVVGAVPMAITLPCPKELTPATNSKRKKENKEVTGLSML